MASRIKISSGEITLKATLNESLTAMRIMEALPLEGKAVRWGEEIYFSIPVNVGESEDAKQDMEVGELAYWPSGSAFCIFFGPTPVSTDDIPRAYSNVNPFGQLDEDASPLKKIQDGKLIRIERLDA